MATRFHSWLAMLACSGCVPALGVPSDASIACSTGDDCPAGYFCAAQIAACVQEGGGGAAPTLTAFDLAGDIFAPGDTIEISFGADETLHTSSPTVELRWADQNRSAERIGSGGSSYRFSYLVAVDDPDGAVVVHVTLVDTDGNIGEADPKTISIDATPPALASTVQPHELFLDSNNLRAADPMPAPTARAETRVRLRLSFTEAVDTVDVVASGPGTAAAATLTFLPVVTAGPGTFEYEVTAADASGTYRVEVVATDLAGNSAQLTDAGLDFTIDTDPPQPPTNLSLVRTPWPTDPTVPTSPRAIVSGDAADVDPLRNDSLRVHIWDRVVAPLELKRSLDLTGAFTIALAQDASHVYASAVDAAGNESALALVDSVTWVASFAGRKIGDDLSNPNRLSRLHSAEPYLFSELLREPPTADLAGVYVAGDGDALVVDSARTWVRRRTPTPADLFFTAATYIPTTGKTFVVGGMTGGNEAAGVLEWNGEQWRELTFAEPATRGAATVVYDEKRDRVVLFSGSGNFTDFFDDTWEWDGVRWHNPLPLGSGLPAPGRAFAAAAYHSREQKLYLFGGLGAAVPVGPNECPGGVASTYLPGFCLLNDFWSWDGASWLPEPCDGACPSPRFGAVMVYDEVEDQLVLFGGYDVDAVPPNGTTPGTPTPDPMYVRSQLSGELSPTWKQVTSSPSLFRFGHGLVSTGSDILLVGGCPVPEDLMRCPISAGQAQATSELRRWNRSASSWELVSVSAAPAPRFHGGAVFDRGRGQLIWFGGQADVRSTATDCTPRTGPPATPAEVQLDHCEGGTLHTESGFCRCSYASTWIFEEGAWRQAAGAVSVEPETQSDAAMAYYESDSEQLSLLFGGWSSSGDCDGGGSFYCGGTWVHRGAVWERWPDDVSPCDNIDCPTARSEAALALLRHPTDPALNALISFGGTTDDPGSCAGGLCRTWSWRPNTSWELVNELVDPTNVTGCQDTNGNPAPCTRAAGVLVSWEVPGATTVADTAVLLFGGRTDALAACSPPTDYCPGSSQCFTDDDGSYCYFNDLWKWDGDPAGGMAWTEICSNCAPPARWEHAMAFDSTRHKVVLTAGCGPSASAATPNRCNDSLLDDVWEWDDVSGWTTAPTEPPLRAEHGMAYDPVRGRVMLYGGILWNEFSDGIIWEYDGSAWRSLPDHAVAAPGMREHGLVVRAPLDPWGVGPSAAVRSRMIAYNAGLFWELPLWPDIAPAVVFDFAWAAAGVDRAAIEDLTLVVHGSGEGYSIDVDAADVVGDLVGGLVIEGWNQLNSRWETLRCNPGSCDPVTGFCTCDAAAPICTCDANPDAGRSAADYLFGGDRIYLRASPRFGDGNGVAPSRISLDYAELRVDYTYVP